MVESAQAWRVTLPMTVRYPLAVALLAVIYYAAARLGLQYASIGQSVSLIWPPTGIALAALTLLGYHYWPGVALGAFLANAATPVPLLAAAGIATGNTLEAVVAAMLLRQVTGARPQLDDLRHTQRFLLAAPAGAALSALIGSTTLWLAGALPTGVISAIAVWWTGDLLGALVVAPVLLAWSSRPPSTEGNRRLLEVAFLCLASLAAAELVLGRLVDAPVLRRVDYHYLLFPFVIWAALRFGGRGAALMTLGVASVTVLHTVRGGGPFIGATSIRTLSAVALYLAAVAVTGLVLAAAVEWERRQATQALARSEERLRHALDAARMGTWVWSVETNTLTWDDNLRQLYGLAPGEPITNYEHFISLVHRDDRSLVKETVQQVLREGGELDYEFRIVLPDGRVRWIADQGEVRRDAEGRPLYLAGVCTDVTERRATEERLRQAQRIESVGRLAGGVAHEANNQMSVVLGAADFILRRPDVPEAVRVDVEFMQKAAERTAAITSQLLAFSRRQIRKPELLDLNALVSTWEPVLCRIMGAVCGVRLRLSPEIGLVRADPGQLQQVLLNLALNARDAMPRGGTIALETFPADLTGEYLRLKRGVMVKRGRYAVLAVSDTGHGMDKETLSHVFEPFFTTKGVGQGTGLGLSTVYGIVKQSDGYIWVYSEPGQGTTFKIYLPVRSGTVESVREEHAKSAAQRSECILVVEDDAMVRHMMKRSLEGVGYRVIDAGNADEALEIVAREESTLSLLLTDVVMPGLNGRELADQITRLRPEMPVLFTSGYTDGEIVQRGLLQAETPFLQKPFTPLALVQAVERQLRARS
jgi:PAS domain S-box-containing protein